MYSPEISKKYELYIKSEKNILNIGHIESLPRWPWEHFALLMGHMMGALIKISRR